MNDFSRPPAWTADALCAQVDPEMFFPENGGTSEPAKAICRRCPVRAECLEYALDHGERYGIFGGLSERERRKIEKLNLRRDQIVA
jgi:WhiB family redox-sensing transcriptional regulator